MLHRRTRCDDFALEATSATLSREANATLGSCRSLDVGDTVALVATTTVEAQE